MKKSNQNQILIFTLITLIFFGNLYRLEYATDTYQVFHFTAGEIFYQFAKNGRFVTAIIGGIIKILQIPEKVIYAGSYILAIICTILSQNKLYKIIQKDVKNKILQIIIPTLIIINPFSIELFLFIEKGIMMLGILLCIYAIEKLEFQIRDGSFCEIFRKKNRPQYKIISAIIFMILANFCYQGIVGIFVAISLVYIIKYSKNIKQFINNNLLVAIIYGIPAILDYAIVKIIYKESRINGEIILIESIKKIFQNTVEVLVKMFEILPKYTYILIILFTFVFLCYTIWRKKNTIICRQKEIQKSESTEYFIDRRKENLQKNIKYYIIEILKIVYIICGVIIIAILPQFLQETSSIWFVPRSTYPLASLYGILLLYLSMESDIICWKEKGKETRRVKIIQSISIVISIILFVLQIQKFYIIEQDRYILNKEDYEITQIIIKQIEKYEGQTNNKITGIEVYEDSNPTYTYNGILAIKDTNIKAYSQDWSTEGILEYYLDRKLITLERNEQTELYFKQNNWNEFNINQIIFEEDKIILCRY